jgi:selenocysteine lyase/cysteine desulfurase
VKEYGAIYAADCAQSAGLLETGIIKIRAVYMVFAGRKTLYGPFGCSGFICKKTIELNPLVYGGTGVDSANENMPSELPMRIEADSYNIMAIAGLHAAQMCLRGAF